MNQTASLPITRNPKEVYILSLSIVLLMSCVSLAGLFYRETFYPTEELRRSFVSNDLVNLLLGVPALSGVMWLTRKERVIGLLFWPGALFYVTYNYCAYAVALPFGLPLATSLGLVALSILGIFRLLSGMDQATIRQRINGRVPERLAGGALIGFGLLFVLRCLGQIAGAITGGMELSGPELGVLVADLLISPAMVIGGALLWQHRASGYIFAAGLLFQGSLLFTGLMVFFILQPILNGVPFPRVDFLVIFSMGLVFFIPTGLFARGISARGQ